MVPIETIAQEYPIVTISQYPKQAHGQTILPTARLQPSIVVFYSLEPRQL
jgi:hypothetical protein